MTALTTFSHFDAPAAARELPQNIEAEQALLGALMLQPRAINHVAGFLRGEHFALPVHGRIFDAILNVAGRGAEPNPVALKNYFERDEALSEAGGAQYLARLVGAAVTIINAGHYGQVILEAYARRSLIRLGNELIERAFDIRWDQAAQEIAQDAIRAADATIDELTAGAASDASIGAAAEAAVSDAEAAHRRGSGLTGAPTGLAGLDDLLGGLHAGELVIVGARPGQGKTALGLGIAEYAARAGTAVLFFSLEMTSKLLGQRAIAMRTGISAHALKRGNLTPDQWRMAGEASADLARLPLTIDDAPNGYTMQGLAAAARRAHVKRPIGLIVVDYLQQILPSASAARRNRVDEVTEMSGGLKRLAKLLNVPVLALAQLSRALEARDNKRPGLADLRDSGSIEQDADVIVFIHREVEYLKRRRPDASNEAALNAWRADVVRFERAAELIVAKHRQGPTATLSVEYDPGRTAFHDLRQEVML